MSNDSTLTTIAERIPAEVSHPSVFIQEEMDARGWDRDQLALRMGGVFVINRLALDCYFEIGPEETGLRMGDAKDFERAFDVSAEFFLNLEKAWLKAQGVQL